MSYDGIFFVRKGDKIKILGMQYTAIKQHLIMGINLFEGTLRIMSEGHARDYTYEELADSNLVSIEEATRA